MYSFNTKYNKNTTNIFKILLDDGIKTKIVFISLYLIKGYWYLDIRDDKQNNILIGRKITSYTDVLKVVKYRDKDFPDVELKALPINVHGFNTEFLEDVAGVLQDLMVIVNEWYKKHFMG